MGSENDRDIQHTHSSALFDAFIDPYLEFPTIPGLLTNSSDQVDLVAQQPLRSDLRKDLVSRVDIHKFGTLDEFMVGGRKVALLKTLNGGHDIPKNEGVQDVIGRMFNLF